MFQRQVKRCPRARPPRSNSMWSERAGSGVPQLVSGAIIRETISHRLFGRKPLRAGFADVVANFSLSCSVIFRGLMVGVVQRIVAQRIKAFSELIGGVPVCGSQHFDL